MTRLEKYNDRWRVTAEDGTDMWNSDLDFAALDALAAAARVGNPEIELGEGVPADALERGQRLREILERVSGRDT
jgi:hypothetical protein